MSNLGWVTAVLILFLLCFTWRARRRQARLLATVEVVTLADVSSQYLGNTRPITIFLPPGYNDPLSGETPYKLLYVNDGQDVAQLRLRETIARLYAAQRIWPIITVAIPANEERLHEYGTAVAVNEQGLGEKAGDYARFVTEEVAPLINRQFRTLAGAANSAILGASLGGLSAFDIAWNHPDQFGIVGVFSGSFWWRAGADDPCLAPGRRIAHEMVRHSLYRPGFRAWFEAGAQDETADRDQNGVIDAIQDTLELIDELVALGYKRGVDVAYVEVKGGRHHYRTWAEALPDFLLWAFPRET